MRWIMAIIAPALLTAAPAAADDGGLQITAVVTIDGGAGRTAADSGVTIIGRDGVELIVRGSPLAMSRLAGADHVTGIEQVWAPQELVVSEGAALVGADIWGQGGHPRHQVTVAIVDTGFAGMSARLGVELPAAVATKSLRFDGLVETGSGHGTAVAEVLHDVAPVAALHLVAVDSDIRFPAVVDYLIANDIDIVNMSLGWTQGPYDGSSVISQQVSRAVAAGITWVNAAGNEATTHWTGSFVDGDGDATSEFADGDEINRFTVAARGVFTVDMAWSGVADLDLCLYSYQEDVATFESCSVLSQGPEDRPAESIMWQNSAGSAADFGYSIRRYSGDPQRVDAFVGGNASGLEHSSAGSSIVVPAEVPDAIAVGAVPWFTPGSLAYYSSRGPTVSGVVKPDFVAPTSVSTAQIPVFSGTSAATPHVAGVAALLLEAEPSLTPEQLKAALAAVALPVAGGGKSNLFGWGRSHAGTMAGQVTLVPPGAPGHDSIGMVDISAGVWDLLAADGSRRLFYYGNPGDVPIAGDWDCDGIDTPGLYRPGDGYVYLRNSNSAGVADVSFYFGNPGDVPLAGDWDGDGCDTVSLHRPDAGMIFISNQLGTGGRGMGAANLAFPFGDPGDELVAADFDGDGATEVAVRRDGVVFFRSSLSAGAADGTFAFGEPDDLFVAGNWLGSEGPGAYRPSIGALFYRNTFAQGATEGMVQFGNPDWYPVAGFWGS
jgi:subtilisin family serine protease